MRERREIKSQATKPTWLWLSENASAALGLMDIGSSHWAGVRIEEMGRRKGQGAMRRPNLFSPLQVVSIKLGNIFRNASDVAANLVAPLLPFWGCWLRTNFTWRLFLSNIYYGNILFTTCPKPVKHEKANLSNVFFFVFLKNLENILHSYFEQFLYLASLNMIWEVKKSKR